MSTSATWRGRAVASKARQRWFERARLEDVVSVRVFPSYRRSDSRHVAGRLRDRLADQLGEQNVFFDVDLIDFGLDFREVIQRTIQTVDVVVAVIGPRFDPPRLAQKNDYVRMELMEAFSQGKLVVPVLVEDAHMPAADELPPDLEMLSYRNAAPLRPDPDFRRDASRLIESLLRAVGDVPVDKEEEAPNSAPHRSEAPLAFRPPVETSKSSSSDIPDEARLSTSQSPSGSVSGPPASGPWSTPVPWLGVLSPAILGVVGPVVYLRPEALLLAVFTLVLVGVNLENKRKLRKWRDSNPPH